MWVADLCFMFSSGCSTVYDHLSSITRHVPHTRGGVYHGSHSAVWAGSLAGRPTPAHSIHSKYANTSIVIRVCTKMPVSDNEHLQYM